MDRFPQPSTAWEAEKTYGSEWISMIPRTDERTLCQFLNDLEGCGAIPARDLNDLIHPGRLKKPIEIKIYQRFGVIDERTL